MADSFLTTVVTAETEVIDEHMVLSFTALCRASGAARFQVQAMVDEGLLQPTGTGPQSWQFSGAALGPARDTLRLARELGLSLHAAAIVRDLVQQIRALQARR